MQSGSDIGSQLRLRKQIKWDMTNDSGERSAGIGATLTFEWLVLRFGDGLLLADGRPMPSHPY